MKPVQVRDHGDCRVAAFHDAATGTFTYLVSDARSDACVVIDPVLAFDPSTGAVGEAPLQPVIEQVRASGGRLAWILETHLHADHLSGAAVLRRRLGGRTAIGAGVAASRRALRVHFDLAATPPQDEPYDRLVEDGELLEVGRLRLQVLQTPGHTPHCVTYRLDTAQAPLLFVGDALLPPAIGTARCDFPGGSAARLHASIERLLTLPPLTEVYTCHDYPAPGETPQPCATLAEHLRHNVQLRDRPGAAAFVARREARDRTLALPVLFEPSLRFNVGTLLPDGA